jgi:acyl-CoA synthetase (AMP-forming)/AMP-acid ligase II
MSRVEQHQQNIAVEVNDICLTYRELSCLCQTLASQLPAPEKGKISRVLIKQEDQLSYLLHILSCWCAGLVPVLLRNGITSADEEFICSVLQPVDFKYQKIDPNEVKPVDFSRPVGAMFDHRHEGMVMGTSGTTGKPKLVALPAEAVSLNAKVISAELALKPGDRVAVCTPLSYMYGLMGGSIATLWAGATLQLFDPKAPLTEFQFHLRNRGSSVVQGPPSLLQIFMAYWNGKPFPGVRMVTTGGEFMSLSLKDGLEAAFPNARKQFLYGMTEAGPRISHLSFDNGGGQDGYIGSPFDHIDWRLVPQKEKHFGEDVSRLALRGPSVFLGYISEDGSYQGLDEEGYFLTNDLVKLLSDGRLSFAGRSDRVFKSGGKLVSPDFIEQVLVKFGGVTGVTCRPDPHEILGLVPVAEVYCVSENEFDKEAFHKHAKVNLEPHCVPRTISFHPGNTGAGVKAKIELSESGKRRLPKS